MQIMYPTAVSLGYEGAPDRLLGIDENIKWGAMYIRDIIDRFHVRRIESVTAIYNAGRTTNVPALTANRMIRDTQHFDSFVAVAEE